MTISLVNGNRIIEPKYLRQPPAGLRDGRVDFQNYETIPMKINEQEAPVMFYKYKNAGICYYFQWNGKWYSVLADTNSELGVVGVDNYRMFTIR